MDIKIGYINVSVQTKKMPIGFTPVIFLHGFTQSSSEWNFILKKLPSNIFPILIDFIGHGKSDSPHEISNYSVDAICSQIDSVYNYFGIKKAIFVAYSMGGRAALSYSSRFPHKVKGLVLESSSPGIVDKKEREKRILADSKLTDFIKENGIKEFVDLWMDLPLFDSLKLLPTKTYNQIKENKLKNNPTGLINSLKGFGTGVMPNLWKNVHDLKGFLLITGELDNKFFKINKKMNQILVDREHKIIKKCGHNIHLEKPDEFSILVNNYLKKIVSEK